MTLQEYIHKLDLAINEFTNGSWYNDIVNDMHANQINRIFTLGKGARSKIGQYSTKTMLASKSQFLKKSAFKQTKAASGVVFSSNVKTRKTSAKKEKSLDKDLWIRFKNRKTGKFNKKATPIMVLDGGYKQFREIQGRQGNFVDLNYSGDLFRDFASGLIKTNSGYISGVKRPINSKKIDAMIKKYGIQVFQIHPYAKKKYNNKVRAKFIELLSKFNAAQIGDPLTTPEPK